MNVRQTRPADRPAVLEVVREAFRNGGDEVSLVERVWAARQHVAELDLVAEVDGVVAGHVLFSEGYVEDVRVLALAPLAVSPRHQRRGLGRALMEESIRTANRLPYPLMLLLGDPAFYGRFGFERARKLGINIAMELPAGGADPFLARRLDRYDPSLRGTFRYFWDTDPHVRS